MLVTINDVQFKVKLLNTQEETRKGMMGKDFDKSFNGMLFDMGKGEHCFWMKNCIIPLDIIFIKDDKISKIHHKCPPCKTEDCKSYCGKGEYVLEVKGGTCKKLGIKVGDLVE